jgi:DNA-binding response OmpR family regulator
MKSSIKIKKDLVQRAQKYAEAAGYSAVEEFVEHLIEKELKKLEEAESDDEIVKKLKGLGYLE